MIIIKKKKKKYNKLDGDKGQYNDRPVTQCPFH